MKTLHGYPLIDDDFGPAQHSTEHGTGYIPRDYEEYPLNGMAHNRESTIVRLTEKEIVELVIEKNAKKSWIVDLADKAGLKPKNQKSSSYCWIHAPTAGMEMARVVSGHDPMYLSAFYAGSQIKHGANQGGSGVQGVKWLAEHGTCVESMWPPMQFHGSETDEIKTNAKLHQVTICEEFDPKDYQLIYSSIVQNQSVTVGIPAWGHEVLVVAAVFAKDQAKGSFGDLRPRFRNSWGDWGVDGCGVLDGAKLKLDEAMRIAAIEESIK